MRKHRLDFPHISYRQLKSRRGYTFATYEAFCVEPQPFGLGYKTADIERIIGERRARTAAEQAESPCDLPRIPGPSPRDRLTADDAPIANDVSNRCKRHGNDPEYLTARIARDRPDILERMKAGEFPSVRKAALEAGIDFRADLPAWVYIEHVFTHREYDKWSKGK